jgi:hypothetical protein
VSSPASGAFGARTRDRHLRAVDGAEPSAESLRLAIESVSTTLVDVPLIRPHKFSVHSMTQQSMVIVRLRTSDGIEGIGEAVVPDGPWWVSRSRASRR